MKRLLNEIKYRIKYNLLCLFAVDGSWSMGSVLIGSLLPFGGFWFNGDMISFWYDEMVVDNV